MEDLKSLISNGSIKHVSIIMDGNGRWAENRGESRSVGHIHGTENVISIAETCDDLGIKYLSLYAFSTENWKRPEKEVSSIFQLLTKFINKEMDRIMSRKIKLHVMGDISKLPLLSRKAVEMALNKTKNNTGLVLNIGLNYGSRSEILRSFKSIYDDISLGKLDLEKIDENTISNYLDTSTMPDPDILIRTGGEKRISNFMLYQLAYTELIFEDCLWPDYNSQELIKSLKSFYSRKRRFGGLNA